MAASSYAAEKNASEICGKPIATGIATAGQPDVGAGTPPAHWWRSGVHEPSCVWRGIDGDRSADEHATQQENSLGRRHRTGKRQFAASMGKIKCFENRHGRTGTSCLCRGTYRPDCIGRIRVIVQARWARTSRLSSPGRPYQSPISVLVTGCDDGDVCAGPCPNRPRA